MQLPGNTRRTSAFRVWALCHKLPKEGRSLKTLKVSLYLSGSCIPNNYEAFLLIICHYLQFIITYIVYLAIYCCTVELHDCSKYPLMNMQMIEKSLHSLTLLLYLNIQNVLMQNGLCITMLPSSHDPVIGMFDVLKTPTVLHAIHSLVVLTYF